VGRWLVGLADARDTSRPGRAELAVAAVGGTAAGNGGLCIITDLRSERVGTTEL